MEKRSVPGPIYEVSRKPQKADQPPLNETNCFLFPKSPLIHCVRYHKDYPQINLGDKHLVKTHRGK